jgi:subtilisin family serine protease
VVAILDSGVHAGHPHVLGVAGGQGFDLEGRPVDDHEDRLGHGTAVAAVIREKAPNAHLLAVKVFDRELRAPMAALLAGLDWALERPVRLLNLSLGTTESGHEGDLRPRVERAVSEGVLLVAAATAEGATPGLPGVLPGVLAVEVDWGCPRHEVRIVRLGDGRPGCRASGFPRPIPGVPPERNLKGVSFAVANVTGLLARALDGPRPVTVADALDLLASAT